jgi:hypothetical protein
MKIEVQDSTGAKCQDSVAVSISRFAYNLDGTPLFVKEGDSLQLCMPIHFGGGFQPYKNFKWASNENISGSDTGTCIYTTPFYRADCYPLFSGAYLGKTFAVSLTDSMGCSVHDGIDVAILSTGINEHNPLTKKIYCSYNQETSMLSFDGFPANENLRIHIFDMSGRVVFQKSTSSSQSISLVNELSSNGIYIVQLANQHGIIERKKIFFGQ